MIQKWQTAPLASVCVFYGDGDWIESKDQSPEGVRLIQTGNVGEGEFKDRAEKARFVSQDTFTRLRCTEIFSGDCLISRLPDPVGRACLIPETGERMITAVDCTVVRFGPNTILPEYFVYYTQTAEYLAAVEREATGTTRKRISRARLGRIPIPLAPLPEQRRIVAILDEAFEGIGTAKANAEKNLKNARELFEGHLAFIFSNPRTGWLRRPLGKVTSKIGSGSTPLGGEDSYKAEGIALIRSLNVYDLGFKFAKLAHLDNEQATKLANVEVQPQDVLLNITGASVARCCIVPSEVLPARVNQHVSIIRSIKAELDAEFLHYFLISRPSKERLLRIGAEGGSTRQAITKAQLQDFIVDFPPNLGEQQLIVGAIDEIKLATERFEAVCEQKIAALDELKKSLLHQAFTGQLMRAKPASVTAQPVLQITTPDFAANVISFAHARHERQKRERTFGHVKAQKVLQMIEALGKIDLGRQPMRDAAGPNDFPHMLKAEAWAKARNFFEMVKRTDGYEFKKLGSFEEYQARANEMLAPYMQQLETIIDLLVPMDTEEAGVFATVHAAWNNLLADGVKVTDDVIVSAAREDWHADKLKIPERKFRDAVALIRQKGIVPDGTAKYVGGQQRLL